VDPIECLVIVQAAKIERAELPIDPHAVLHAGEEASTSPGGRMLSSSSRR
jgi:hypothetical protein